MAGGDCVARGFRGRAGASGDNGDSSGESVDEEYREGVQERSDPEKGESNCKVGFGNIQVHSSRIRLRCPGNIRDTAPASRWSSHSTTTALALSRIVHWLVQKGGIHRGTASWNWFRPHHGSDREHEYRNRSIFRLQDLAIQHKNFQFSVHCRDSSCDKSGRKYHR